MAHLRLELITLYSVVCVVFAVPPKYYMDIRCGDTLTISGLPSIRLDLTRYSKYKNNMDCTLTVKAAPTSRTNTTTNKRLMLVFRKLDIKGSNLFGCSDQLYIYDGPSTSSSKVPGLARSYCGENEPRGAYMSSGDSLTFRFVSDFWNTDDGFKLLLTPFHTGTCTASEYRCDRGQCIAGGNKCDGYKQCGEYTDECEVTKTMTWIAGVVIGVIAVVVVIGVTVFCLRKHFLNRQNSGGAVKYTAPPQQTSTPYYQQPGTAPGYYPQGTAPPPQGYPPQNVAYPPQNPTYPPLYPEQQQGYPPPTNPYPYGAPTNQ
ncbi:enteropeptidase-like [Saccostrea echinata]|uniref:enteropeptidase-like n=1 Tax=Saccostrea echinata TaxID=191078 RepID=UPI002A7FA616|nr:enteropeptidase-like [Saccostrea echinata]